MGSESSKYQLIFHVLKVVTVVRTGLLSKQHKRPEGLSSFKNKDPVTNVD